MDDKKWEQFAALGGVLFVVANLVGAAASGEPPSPDGSAAEIAAWFTDSDGILLSQALAGIGSIGLLWWAGSLWRRLSAAEGTPRPGRGVDARPRGLGCALPHRQRDARRGRVRIARARPGIADLLRALNGVLLAAAGFFVPATHVGATSVSGSCGPGRCRPGRAGRRRRCAGVRGRRGDRILVRLGGVDGDRHRVVPRLVDLDARRERHDAGVNRSGAVVTGLSPP